MARRSAGARIQLLFASVCLACFAAILLAVATGWARGILSIEAVIQTTVVAGILILSIGVVASMLAKTWLIRPIDRIAATLRIQASGVARGGIDLKRSRLLGDLAPAADAISVRLARDGAEMAETIEGRTADLHRDQSWLETLLTKDRSPVILVSSAGRIVLYDTRIHQEFGADRPLRLDASIGDYLDPHLLNDLDEASSPIDLQLAAPDTAHALKARAHRIADGATILSIDRARTHGPSNPTLVYDFALLNRPGETVALAQTPLDQFSFCVFDTETTGLDPQDDEVIQIGAVRVVNGAIVQSECFETLVDPGRPVPPSSTRIHGLTSEMVRGAPSMREASRGLHGFAKGSVLVAHNTAFDMRFLRKSQCDAGVVWNHPTIDTARLSAVAFGRNADHRLEALCERLEVSIPKEARHTAMGDARVTAKALVKLFPLLRAIGVITLGDLKSHDR